MGEIEQDDTYVQLYSPWFFDPRNASISKLIWPSISRPRAPGNRHQSAAPARGVQALPAAAAVAAPTHGAQPLTPPPTQPQPT
jgi:hypothetical protein